MTNYIGHDGYPQPEIVAIATGKPNAAATTVVGPAALAADCFDIKFGSVMLQGQQLVTPLSAQSSAAVDLMTDLDTIAEADDSVEM